MSDLRTSVRELARADRSLAGLAPESIVKHVKVPDIISRVGT